MKTEEQLCLGIGFSSRRNWGKKRTIVAVIVGAKAETISRIIEKISLKQRNLVTETTLEMAENMGLNTTKCIPNAIRIINRFHIQKLATEVLQKIIIKYRWQAIHQENQSFKKQ